MCTYHSDASRTQCTHRTHEGHPPKTADSYFQKYPQYCYSEVCRYCGPAAHALSSYMWLNYMWLMGGRNGIARVAHARASTLAACANTRRSNMASRLARATRGRVEQRRVVHVSWLVMVRAEARWWKGYLRHGAAGYVVVVVVGLLVMVDGMVPDGSSRFSRSARCGHASAELWCIRNGHSRESGC